METLLDKTVNIPANEILELEGLLVSNGVKYCTVWIDDNLSVHVRFPSEEDYTIFILKGLIEKIRNKSGYRLMEPDFDFMRRLEKKLKTFSVCDEYIIRKVMRDA